MNYKVHELKIVHKDDNEITDKDWFRTTLVELFLGLPPEPCTGLGLQVRPAKNPTHDPQIAKWVGLRVYIFYDGWLRVEVGWAIYEKK
ncbi:hypothetical protein O9G_002922 [Rozella allomycis CSF55]|uniref:Uncharacterized protein n=1 Tax=Rozella allomycis (strain CSF55) TaxID=988480 RepID=A0A075B217_ROZAC|nr:hypothetical protein O9G_002922 [Rozella allomycis CSF55]|eukprot:EPZ36420.1 hypothetical protein O9G_002922 [Rozella allomycis CSF55]